MVTISLDNLISVTTLVAIIRQYAQQRHSTIEFHRTDSPTNYSLISSDRNSSFLTTTGINTAQIEREPSTGSIVWHAFPRSLLINISLIGRTPPTGRRITSPSTIAPIARLSIVPRPSSSSKSTINTKNSIKDNRQVRKRRYIQRFRRRLYNCTILIDSRNIITYFTCRRHNLKTKILTCTFNDYRIIICRTDLDITSSGLPDRNIVVTFTLGNQLKAITQIVGRYTTVHSHFFDYGIASRKEQSQQRSC